MRIAVLVSGRGSNLEAVLRAGAAGRLPGLDPVLVISNRAGVPALDVATRYGVAAIVMSRAGFGDLEERDREIGRAVTVAGADLVLLAGYDQVLRASYFEVFRGRTINIHPSLLPAHGGRGMVGPAVHASVLAAGDRRTGVTIHEVTHELDMGPILAQESTPVAPGEEVTRLAARVLEIEHRLLVELLARLSSPQVPGMASARMTAGRVPDPPPTISSGGSRFDA